MRPSLDLSTAASLGAYEVQKREPVVLAAPPLDPALERSGDLFRTPSTARMPPCGFTLVVPSTHCCDVGSCSPSLYGPTKMASSPVSKGATAGGGVLPVDEMIFCVRAWRATPTESRDAERQPWSVVRSAGEARGMMSVLRVRW